MRRVLRLRRSSLIHRPRCRLGAGPVRAYLRTARGGPALREAARRIFSLGLRKLRPREKIVSRQGDSCGLGGALGRTASGLRPPRLSRFVLWLRRTNRANRSGLRRRLDRLGPVLRLHGDAGPHRLDGLAGREAAHGCSPIMFPPLRFLALFPSPPFQARFAQRDTFRGETYDGALRGGDPWRLRPPIPCFAAIPA